MKIIEKMKPNSARMWDYIMGGSHNFAVDRYTVKLVRKIYPIYEESLWEQRRFLQRAVTYMAQEKGLTTFIDFGSGLPTRGNIHEVVHDINPDIKVLYSDSDPITVALSQEILSGTPNVDYILCDVTNSFALLDSPVTVTMCGNNRKVGIGLIGVAVVVADKPLAKFFDGLYTWAAPGSYIAVTAASRNLERVKGMPEASRKFGIQFFARSAQEVLDVIPPWKLTEPGLVPGLYWGLPEDSPEINEEIRESSYSFVAYK
ncbi:MAG: SAM-dependent methyltransferase [Candidatus Methanofastidiosia archaeon]|jgi:hypothetical protein